MPPNRAREPAAALTAVILAAFRAKGSKMQLRVETHQLHGTLRCAHTHTHNTDSDYSTPVESSDAKAHFRHDGCTHVEDCHWR